MGAKPTPPSMRSPPTMTRLVRPLLAIGVVLLCSGVVSGYRRDGDGAWSRRLKQNSMAGGGGSNGQVLASDLTVVTVPGAGAVATQTTTTQTTSSEGATTTTTTTTTAAVADSSSSGASSTSGTESAPAAPAAPAVAGQTAGGTAGGNTPAAAYVATAVAGDGSRVFYASTQTTGAQQHDSLTLHMATARKGVTIPEYCTHDQASELASEFTRLLTDVPFYTACGDHTWMDDLNKISPRGPKVMMDIGCNKGYTSAKMFGLWAPEVGFSPKAIPTKRPEVWCGNCGDCQEEVHPALDASDGGLTVYCFEPSQANFAQLVVTRDAFFKDNPSSVQWLTMNLAMSNTTGVARFSRECTSEQCALNVAAKRNVDLIDTTTVDDFLLKHKIPRVDVLKIDTEGFDATVLMGAMSSIAAGRVGVISFEYHEVGVWKEYRLKHVIEWLAGFGYVCYFDGKGSVARLTGCWDDRYEIYQWSNVVCVPRSTPLYQAVEKRSLRYQKMPQLYKSAAAAASSDAAEGAGATAQHTA